MRTHKIATLALAVSAAFSSSVLAQEAATTEKKEASLEQITVTAQKRTQSIQEVPISISTLSGEQFESLFSGGGDILELATRVPGLYAESSNGRVAPRFYIRGLGNTDFDLAASQPVAIMMDGVVKENVILKSFPLFDVSQVEVLRGPQGTLFGRNTTAGIVKFDTNKPTQDFEAFTEVSVGNLGTFNAEAAISGGLTDELSGRFSVLSQNRGDWIDNGFTGESDAMGEYEELAWRGQLLWEPTSLDMTALLSVHGRDLDGTSTIFRANALTTGSNDFNANYDRDRVYYDGGAGNRQKYTNEGAALTLDFFLNNGMTLTSITSYEQADGSSRGDIDGGAITLADQPVPDVPNGFTFAEYMSDIDFDGVEDAVRSYPGFIPFSSDTTDLLDNLEQVTQEVRLASDTSSALSWQTGIYLFSSEFDVTTDPGFVAPTTVTHESSLWAVFGQADYKASEKLTITAGIRYTDDEKELTNANNSAPIPFDPIKVDDQRISGDLSANYKIDNNVSVYARYAHGFRGPTIQGRDVAFFGAPSVAESEVMDSFEVGFKADLLDDTLRVNGAVYYYTVDDMQFSAIGGADNLTQLVNAENGTGQGFEIDVKWLATDSLLLTAGYSFNDTEIDDPNLLVAPCGSGQCTVTDELVDNLAIVDGNPFPQAPEQTFVFTARYSIPMGDSGEFFAFTDWAWQGETNIFLYDAVEFQTDSQFEGGLRLGYENFDHEYTVALFGRNITDEENLRGAIDFNNLTAIDNSPRVFGIEFRKSFY
ncbi:TonB-dependent receptor [Alteromonas mediterranea]|uniref:TonB-dependent receptor n=1 Tax=Alteromonas mediterranea TaxID=314275 RepID=UPI000903A0B0|nr:TonB-dependent receptor [Alteromonas mediterranea]APD94344.1 TonB-dependent receptor [Alteromonas mediterranea]APD97976.1 TonB-dependent receptor [Alteromonas mediterranea]APE02216.1 TonB-dependent receptor [Alteromonas mediterranea]QDG35135.1 TonB-dependent receptor [Alteromonas mediterranea]QDG38731.1 TonB-dependent receptor [Alteromonas mediterranea]